MAKLENVKVVDMKAGEVTKVEYGGKSYSRAEHPIRQGDLVLNVGEDDELDITIGSYYEITHVGICGDTQFLDDVDDTRIRENDDTDFVPFRAVKTREDFAKGDKVRLLSGGGDFPLLEFVNGEIYEVLDPSTNAHNGTRVMIKGGYLSGYALPSELEIVKQAGEEPLKVGDYAKVVPHDNTNHFGGKPGDIVKIVDINSIRGRYKTEELDGGNYNFSSWALKSALVRATDEEVSEALEALKTQFSVGDYAKVIGVTYHGDIGHGDIVKITHEMDSDGDYRIELVDDGDFDYAKPRSLAKLSEEESREIKEREKWAKIGRKPNEFKEGDIVRVISGIAYGHGNGTIGVVVLPDGSASPLVKANGEAKFDTVELVAPVESRFDRD